VNATNFCKPCTESTFFPPSLDIAEITSVLVNSSVEKQAKNPVDALLQNIALQTAS
jgi:hypothetical protein